MKKLLFMLIAASMGLSIAQETQPNNTKHTNALQEAEKKAATILKDTFTPQQNLLTGDTRLACEAILCLSSGVRPGECSPSLRRYFSIHHKKIGDTIRARLNFLQLCPASSDTANNMPNLVNAIANGAGRCDAAYLNQANRYRVGRRGDKRWRISSHIPNYCKAYSSHEYTYEVKLPKYQCANQWGRNCFDGRFVD